MSDYPIAGDTLRPITVRQLFEFVWDARKSVIQCVLLSIVLCLIWIAVTPRKYETKATFAATASNSLTSAQDSALRSLVSLGRPGAGQLGKTSLFTRFTSLLTSVRVAEMLNTRHPEVLQTIMYPLWDPDRKEWKRPSGPLAAVKNAVKGVLGMQPWQPPGADTLSEYLSKNMTVSQDDVTGIVTVMFRHKDPVFAAHVVSWTTSAADEVLRRNDKERTSRRIAYLKGLLPSVTNTDQRTVLINLLSQEEQNSMVLEADPTYAAEAVILPVPSRTPVWPKPALMFGVCVTLGALIGLILHAWGQFMARRGIKLSFRGVLRPVHTEG